MEFKDNSKTRKSLLHSFLSKRSTKVEPHPFDDRNGSSSFKNRTNNSNSSNNSNLYHRQLSTTSQEHQTSVSANSTPIKRLNKIAKLNKLWQCHGSTQSLASNHSAPSYFLRKTSNHSKNKIRTTGDRHSHPIGNTVSFLDQTHEIPPDSKSYNVYYKPDNNNVNIAGTNQPIKRIDQSSNGIVPNNIHHSFSTDRFGNANSNHVLTTNKSQDMFRLDDEDDEDEAIDEIDDCDLSSNQKSPTSKSHEGYFTSTTTDSNFPIGHSIAMASCRSRFREKLLPPGYEKLKSQNSFPNITHATSEKHSTNSNNVTTENRKGRSFSCEMLPPTSNVKRTGKTESLAKNSLMAAQLINLIPTEVAKERYFIHNCA